MRLNVLKPAPGSRPKAVRLGRGMGSGMGKTCGFGHKGQKARSGYGRKKGFEGGQLPIHRRLPKFGFSSRLHHLSEEVRLGDLDKLTVDQVNLVVLKQAKLVGPEVRCAKVILNGVITRAISLVEDGIKVTKGAKQAIEQAGGSILSI